MLIKPTFFLGFTSPRFTSPRFTSPRFTSPRFASPRFTSPRLTSPRFTSPRFTSPVHSSPVHEIQYAIPAVQTWTANCKRDRKAVVTRHFAVCGLPFPTTNLMLKVPIVSNSYNTVPTLRRCVALKFAVANRHVYSVTSTLTHLISSLRSMQAPVILLRPLSSRFLPSPARQVTSFRFNISQLFLSICKISSCQRNM